jgi:NAD(P)-dependent dehydrogenase (short-subunit alcohol dehydrogenase family)
VTGAGKGIGRAIAEGLAGAGYAVGICARSEGVEPVAQALRDAGADARAWRADLADTASVRTFVDEAAAHFGRIDVLVNNAGLNRAGTLRETDPADLDAMLEVNVRGTFVAMQAAAEHMARQGGGRIVNVASWVARSPAPGYLGYSASKAAVGSLTRGAALELAEAGITVNAVSPGNVWTDIWESSSSGSSSRDDRSARELFDKAVLDQPIKRGVAVEEVAHAVLFLCSAGARSITGEALVIASGL